MKFLLSHQIDTERWDRIVDQSPNGRIYGYSWYLGGLADNWGALIEGDYEYIMPLPYSRKYGVYYSFLPPYVQQIGVYSDRKEITSEAYARFFHSIPPKIRLVDIGVSFAKEELLAKRYDTRKRTNLILEMNRPYEEIEKGFSRNVRRIIRDTSFSYRLIEDFEDLSGIVSTYQKDVLEDALIPGVYHQRLLHVATIAKEKNQLLPLKLLDADDKLLASFLFFTSHGRVYSIAGGQTKHGRKLHATYLLMNEFFKRYSQRYSLFDFEGSDIPGVAEFFKKWGGVPEYYSRVRFSRFPVNLLK